MCIKEVIKCVEQKKLTTTVPKIKKKPARILLSDDERKKKRKEYMKQYYENNKDKDQYKEYMRRRVEIISKDPKSNYQKNKHSKLKYQKKQGENKFICECGSNSNNRDHNKHLQTIKHRKYEMSKYENNPDLICTMIELFNIKV